MYALCIHAGVGVIMYIYARAYICARGCSLTDSSLSEYYWHSDTVLSKTSEKWNGGKQEELEGKRKRGREQAGVTISPRTGDRGGNDHFQFSTCA